MTLGWFWSERCACSYSLKRLTFFRAIRRSDHAITGHRFALVTPDDNRVSISKRAVSVWLIECAISIHRLPCPSFYGAICYFIIIVGFHKLTPFVVFRFYRTPVGGAGVPRHEIVIAHPGEAVNASVQEPASSSMTSTTKVGHDRFVNETPHSTVRRSDAAAHQSRRAVGYADGAPQLHPRAGPAALTA